MIATLVTYKIPHLIFAMCLQSLAVMANMNMILRICPIILCQHNFCLAENLTNGALITPHQSPLLSTWINFNPSMNKYLHQLKSEIMFPSLNFNSCTIEVWKWISDSSHSLLGMWLLIHAGIKVNLC